MEEFKYVLKNDVVIRTNSAGTTLNVNAPGGEVAHFGSAGSVAIKEVKTSSYSENGKVAFLEIEKGRIVLESESNVEHIHVDKKENANEFDTVIIKDNGTKNLPKTITRDEVNVSAQTLVVTVELAGGSLEAVYVYASGTSGSTEKTATQNTGVNSTLGGLVLDNGSEAGEKALNGNEKSDVKSEVVAIALDEERKEVFNEQNYWIGVASDAFAGGDGSNEHPYLIATPEQLSRLAYVMYSSQYAQYQNKSYKLTANIDLSAKCWVPIVTSARANDMNRYFSGTFDGADYTITGLNNTGLSMSFIDTMKNDSTPVDGVEYVYGLFGDIDGATIKNVKLENVSIKNGYGLEIGNDGKAFLSDSVGALVGYSTGNVTITNCHTLSGIVEGYDGVSGIVGKWHDSNNISTDDNLLVIDGCTNAATINAVRRACGIIGNIRGTQGIALAENDPYPSVGAYVINCTNSGDITSGAYEDVAPKGETSNYYCAYGIAAVNRAWYRTGTTTYGTGTNAWEKFYLADSPSFSGCSNTGTLTNNFGHYTGAIAGGNN